MAKENSNEQYFGVVYQTAEYKGAICLLPRDSKEACLDALRKLRDDPNVRDRIVATTVIKRDMSNFKDGKIFGCPKSLDVMQEKPKIGLPSSVKNALEKKLKNN